VREKNRFVFLRLKGQETSLEVEVKEHTNILHEFKHQYKKVYGHWIKDRMVEVESIRLRVIVTNEKKEQLKNRSKKYSPKPLTKRNIYSPNQVYSLLSISMGTADAWCCLPWTCIGTE
jgi:5-oxoprolinase (ATP-hydrolysing)